MNKAAKWTIAFAFSLASHAGAAIALLPAESPPTTDVLGGEEMDVAVLGNAFEETVAAGEVTDRVDPVETPPEEVSSIEPETTATETETIAPETPPDTVSETVPETVTTEADVVLPPDAEPPISSEEPEVVAALPPVATVIPETRPETPPEPDRAEAPPVKKPVRKAEPDKPKKPPEPRRSGKEGKSAETANRGSAGGVETAVATSSGRGSKAREAGNSSFSSYTGKVQSKVRRALRYPSKAESGGVKGTVHLQFVVAANGGVSGVKVVKSAGSSALDAAAVEAAKRAAPYPPIPEAANRASWLFTVPISFTR